MAVTVVSRGEAAKKKAQQRRIEIDKKRGITRTIKSKKSSNSQRSTPEKQEYRRIGINDEQAQQSRLLTPFETEALIAQSGGQSQYKPGTFSQEGQEVLISQRSTPKQRVTSYTPYRISGGLEKIEQAKKAEAAEREKALSGSKKDFNAYLAREREKKTAEIFARRERYGNLYGSGGERLAARASIGFQRIGLGAESFLKEQRLKLEFGRRKDIGKSSGFYPYDVLKLGGRDAATAGLKFGEGVVRGGVTGIGRDKTTAAFFAGSTIVGGAAGIIKGLGVTDKIGGFVKSLKGGSSMIKGLKGGAALGVTGLVAADIGTSKNPLGRSGEITGEFLALGSGFEIGRGAGRVVGSSARAAAPYAADFVKDIPVTSRKIFSQKLGRKWRGGKTTQIKLSDRPGKIVFSGDTSGRVGTIKGTYYQKQYKTPLLERPGSIKGLPKGRRTPLSKTFGTTEVGGGNQKLIQRIIREQTPRPQRLAQQKPTLKQLARLRDPAQSRYAAQNMKTDVLTDTSRELFTSPQTAPSLQGGFRSDKMRSELYGRLSARREELGLRRFTREAAGAEGILPAGNIPKEKTGLYEELLPVIESRQGRAGAFVIKQEKPTILSTPSIGISTSTQERLSINNYSRSALRAESALKTPELNDVLPRSTALTSGGRGRKRTRRSALTTFSFSPAKPPLKSSPALIENRVNAPGVPARPRTPRGLLPRLSLPGKRSGGLSPAYDVYVRRAGSFRLIGSGLSRGEALRIGSLRVGSTAAATFKLKKTGYDTAFTGGGLLRPADYYRKGSLFIEKPSRRIKSPGELEEITFKGLAALKGKGGLRIGKFSL